MISSEFEKAVMAGNLLLTRIMLKDSLLLDPTFDQFDEMLSYAKRHFPNLFVPFDGEMLETDETLWNRAVMDQELTALVTNFSEVRVNHLKRVVAKVLAEKAKKIRCEREEKKRNQHPITRQTNKGGVKSKSKKGKPTIDEGIEKKIKIGANEIRTAIANATTKGWNSYYIKEIEDAAQKICDVIREYNANK